MPPQGSDDRRQLGLYYAYAQVGMEMVVPIGLGWWLDDKLGWSPWLTVIGVILGLVVGFSHLVMLLNRQDEPKPPGENGP